VDRIKDNSNLDAIITYVLLKKLCTPIVKSPAYIMGIVNASGKVVKRPSTDEEKISFTILDEIVFWLKRNLGGKVAQLNSFLYTLTSGNNFYNKLVAIGSVEQRAEIIRIKKDVAKLSESLGYSTYDMLKMMIREEVEINEGNK
jgi:hypothetical protein